MNPFSLNVTADYSPDWSVWEVDREITCNCLDADPGYERAVLSDHHIRYWTSTAPSSFKHLTTIGAGTKAQSAETIGQFGEGAKLAALVATRNGWDITFKSSEGCLSFSLVHDPDLNTSVLHATLDPSGAIPSGLVVDFIVPPDQPAIPDFSSRYLDPDLTPTTKGFALKPDENSEGFMPDSIYVKGVRICETPRSSLFSWNFTNITLNRDRSVISNGNLTAALLNALPFRPNVLTEIIDIIDNPDYHSDNSMADDGFAYWESSELLYQTGFSLPLSKAIAKEFCSRYTTEELSMMTLPTGDPIVESLCRNAGFRILNFTSPVNNAIFHNCGGVMKTIADHLDKIHNQKPKPWPRELRPLHNYLKKIAALSPFNPKILLFDTSHLDDADTIPRYTILSQPTPTILLNDSLLDDYTFDIGGVAAACEECILLGLIDFCGSPGLNRSRSNIAQLLTKALVTRKTSLPTLTNPDDKD